MAGARELGEVESFDADAISLDDKGYVLSAVGAGNGEVQKAPTGTSDPLVGANYVSTEDQSENVVARDVVGVVRESPKFPVQVEADDYRVGDDLYISSSNAGVLNKTDTGNQKFGTVAEEEDTTGNGISKVLVRFVTE